LALIKGRRCDRDGCETFVENGETTPVGWVKVTPVVGEAVRDDNSTMEYCSNYCHAVVAVLRYEDIEGKKFTRYALGQLARGKGNQAAVEGGKRAAHTRLHTNKGVKKDGCDYCYPEQAEQPSGNGLQDADEVTI
jgi:hypothetical protein